MEPLHPLAVERRAHKIVGINKNMTSKRDERKKTALDKQIDDNLKRVYEQDSEQEVPDRFLALLEKLREQE
ncbi:NepR family anti-sigma factor [Paracoccus aerodenitrificans]|uniref:NepR family anti-sigma factor n=1 Tax=Paracoccus aerodenitrificans TaxID=3017781 RepID=UPI0022F060DC|nr:NepR family anti-sigma factor [Paracoccus aerodenitrificans]WBU63824.1 NepR family anti-sigma factor [Paracoccus aerodenitrificans]